MRAPRRVAGGLIDPTGAGDILLRQADGGAAPRRARNKRRVKDAPPDIRTSRRAACPLKSASNSSQPSRWWLIAAVIGRPNNSARPRDPKSHIFLTDPALRANARKLFLTCVRIRMRRLQ